MIVTPLPSSLGAEVGDIDLAQADGKDVAALLDALARHLVLVFRDQALSDEALLAASHRFGVLDPPGPNPYGEPFHKTHPEINVISNIVRDGKAIGDLGAGEAVWHADMTFEEQPPAASILYALEVPPTGGDTYFADMYRAYEALPEAMKVEIEGKVAIHDASHNSAGIRRSGYAEVTDVRQTPGARHPLVRTDPRTGRRSLFLGRRPRAYVLGLSVADSEDLLDRLWAHIADPALAMRHRWRVGDAVMWSNMHVLHRRDAFDANSRRRLYRTQIRSFVS